MIQPCSMPKPVRVGGDLTDAVLMFIPTPPPHPCLQPRAKATRLCTMVSPNPSQLYRGPRSNLWFLALFLTISPTLAQFVTHNAANILIYSATRDFRHDSIPTAIQSLKSRSAGYNITFEDTEDLTWFREDRLGRYDAVVFLSTTGESESFESRSSAYVQYRLKFCAVLDVEGKAAFQNYLNKGGNFVAIHSASDSLNTTTFFGQEVGQWFRNSHLRRLLKPHIGAYFDYHPPISRAVSGTVGQRPTPIHAALTDRECARQGPSECQHAPRQVGGHR